MTGPPPSPCPAHERDHARHRQDKRDQASVPRLTLRRKALLKRGKAEEVKKYMSYLSLRLSQWKENRWTSTSTRLWGTLSWCRWSRHVLLQNWKKLSVRGLVSYPPKWSFFIAPGTWVSYVRTGTRSGACRYRVLSSYQPSSWNICFPVLTVKAKLSESEGFALI